MTKKTIFILFCVVVAIGFGLFFYYKDTVFSKQFLKLEIMGQDFTKAGEEITYTVKYKNNSNFILKDPKIIFQLPDNSLTEDGKMRLSQNLKNINPGQEDFIKFTARLLGKEGDLKIANVSFSYTPENLSARYESSATFTTKIDSVPINMTFDLPAKSEKGREIDYSINYLSNIDYPLENLSIKVISPSGFNFISSTPNSLDRSEWKLQTLNKSNNGTLKIKGVIFGESNDILNFSAKLGMWQDGSFIVIKEIEQNLEIVSPSLLISQKINGSSDYSPKLGETLNYQIFLKNNGSESISNLSVSSLLSGQAFDFVTLKSNVGQIKSGGSLIFFDSQNMSELSNFLPEEEAIVEFNVKLKDSVSNTDNIIIKNKVSVGNFVQEFNSNVGLK